MKNYEQDKDLQRKDQEKGDQPRNPDPWQEPEQLNVKRPAGVRKKDIESCKEQQA